MSNILKMKSISKRFGAVQALKDVSLTLREGTVNALVGENGAGKSTLMKILAGAYTPEEGSIEIDGEPKSLKEPAAAIEAGISMIYQELDLADELTVAENVFLGSEPACGFGGLFSSHRQINEQTTRLAADYGFDISPDVKVSSLTTGDCQIVEILKALRRQAKVIVMDEPTSSLSENEADKLFAIIKRLRKKQISIIYISHRLEEVEHLADDVTVLRDGKLICQAPMSELDIPKIVHYMVGRELDDFYPARSPSVGDVWLKVDNISAKGVENVSFEVRKGEIVAMAGLIGAGRTETANAVFGIEPLISGKICIKGKEVSVKNPADAIKNGMALLTEDRKNTGLCLNLPCGWNITLPNLEKITRKGFLPLEQEQKRAKQMAEKLSVKWASVLQPACSLSGGNQQKLLIARWLMAQSEFIIFDEPTRGIDVGAKREVYELLNELSDAGKAILVISSELPELFGIADRILVMRRGSLTAQLDTKQTNADEVMHYAALETTDEKEDKKIGVTDG